MVFYPLAVAICAVSGVSDNTVLYDFQADWCGPCRSMQPAVERLKAAGFPVRQVNIDRDPQLAARYHVTQIPCFVAVVDGQEHGRQVGEVGYEQLEQMVTGAGMHPGGIEGGLARGPSSDGLLRRIHLPGLGRRSSEPGKSGLARSSGGTGAPAGVEPSGFSQWQLRPRSRRRSFVFPVLPRHPDSAVAGGGRTWTPDVTATRPAGTENDATLEARLLAASVRLKVEDSAGRNYGSGTIIDYRPGAGDRGGEALVLTCGHIFRQSQGNGSINIDLFEHGASRTVEGHMIRFDLQRDVGLVSFRTDKSVTVVSLASADHKTRQGDTVISVGCDNGEDPSVHRSRVTAINSFVGPPNVQVAGQPAVGRSGGGLFDDRGQLIGVSNFADPRDHAGLFADVVSARELLDQAGLSEIHRNTSLAAGRAPGTTSATPSMPDQMPRSAPTETAAVESGVKPATEVICIVRSRNGADARNETIFISNASPELLNRLAAEQRTAQAPFPTSLAVAGHADGRETPAPAAAAPVEAANSTTPAANSWQPQWR